MCSQYTTYGHNLFTISHKTDIQCDRISYSTYKHFIKILVFDTLKVSSVLHKNKTLKSYLLRHYNKSLQYTSGIIKA